MKRVLIIIGYAIGIYLIGRAIVEPFSIDMTNPATYRDDWGGPSLVGVLAVHCVPGILAAVIMWRHQVRRRARGSPTTTR
ncbi:MAG: hypothetical protein GEU79_19305 [Acidimicrobiia bacterium]|nr:hypothetical protein [Acidimicrobiia bacterium]